MSSQPRVSSVGAATRVPDRGWSLRRGFARSVRAPGALRRWVLAVVALGLAYAAAIALLGVGGGVPGTPPWLAIPRESYFLAESTFTAPVIVGATLLAASTAYLVGRALGSAGSYDATLITLARATCLASLCSLVPDLFLGLTTTLGVFDGAQVAAGFVSASGWRVFLWAYLSAYLLAFLVLYPTAVSVAHPALKLRSAVVVGWTTFAVYQGVLLVFIR